MSGMLGMNESLGWICGACGAQNDISSGSYCSRCLTPITYKKPSTSSRSTRANPAARKMLAIKKTDVDREQLSAARNNIEKFCKLMERGLEVDLPASNSIRVLFVDRERTAIHIAPVAAEVFQSEMAIKFENILRINELTEVKHASRVDLLYKDKHGKVAHFEFDVDTDNSRRILADMLSKVASAYSSKTRGSEDITITGALSNMFSHISASFWGADQPAARKPITSGRKSAAFRRQISSEGRDLFRSSMDSSRP